MSPGPAHGRARREAILSLVEEPSFVVDVGCDHGYIGAALAARGLRVVATERRSQRLPKHRVVPMIVADGLRPFRALDLVIIAGMGAHVILEMLSGPVRPKVAIVHAPERTDSLRQGLADAGWRNDAERLAPEAGRFAEVIRVVPGKESHRGHALWMGPLLPADPLWLPHARGVLAHWQRVAARAPDGSGGRERAEGWVRWLGARLSGA